MLPIEKLAEAAQLQGKGLSCDEIASVMRLPPYAVRKSLAFAGIKIDTPPGGARWVKMLVGRTELVVADAGADARGIDREGLALRVSKSVFSDPGFLDNILDDGAVTPR